MRILIIGATMPHLAAAARLRRLDEAAKIILIDEAAYIPGLAAFKHDYRIDLRQATRFISADLGYVGTAVLEDFVTRHIYQEEFDKIINLAPQTDCLNLNANDFAQYFDADIAAQLAAWGVTQLTLQNAANDSGRRIADEIYGRPQAAPAPVTLRFAQTGDMRLAFFGHGEGDLNQQQIEHIYSIMPISGGFLKLIYNELGHILGFAAIAAGADIGHYASAVAAAAQMSGNIHNLLDLQLTDSQYPLRNLAKIAQNVVEKRLHMAYPDEVASPSPTLLLDVRSAADFAAGHLPAAFNIPLDVLRESLYRLEQSKEIITICANGKQSYLAARILTAHGFRARHLTGGMAYYRVQRSEFRGQMDG